MTFEWLIVADIPKKHVINCLADLILWFVVATTAVGRQLILTTIEAIVGSEKNFQIFRT